MEKAKKLCEVLTPLSVAVMVIVLFRYVLFIGYVPSASMEPTLKMGRFLGVRIIGLGYYRVLA